MKSGIQFLLFLLLLLPGSAATAQELRTRNVILITLDGFRWQELFQGADSALLFMKKYTKDKNATLQFWNNSAAGRREKLMPFVWNVIGNQGQLYGNRVLGNRADCSNPFRFSSPGYSEMLVGFVDRRINSNNSVSPNPTVLEFIGRRQGYQDSVAVFSSWHGVSLIALPTDSSIQVNAGRALASGELSETEKTLNAFQQTMSREGPRRDSITFQYAFEYLKRARPRVLYISFNDTDRYGHRGEYDKYLASAHDSDRMIGMLWDWIQSQDDYRDQTTLLITTDHGRGKGPRRAAWKHHGRTTPGSSQIWMAVIGPDTQPSGEMKTKGQYFQKQVAGTLAAFLGLDYSARQPVGEVIQNMIQAGMLSENIRPSKNVPNIHK